MPVTDGAQEIANATGVTIEVFDIIYSLLDYVTRFCSSLLAPELKYIDVATAEVCYLKYS